MRNICALTASGCTVSLGLCNAFHCHFLFVLLHCHCPVFQAVSSSGNLMLPKFWELGIVAFSKAWTELKTSILPNGIFPDRNAWKKIFWTPWDPY